MITITPILEGDLDDACREYLRDEFQTHRFGTRSLLFCNPERPGARPTAISQTEASYLLRGGEANGTISDRERVGAWKFSFSGSQSLSVLYALAPEKYAARIENGQVETAHAALGELAGCLLDAEEQKGFMGTLLDNRDTPASPSTDDRPEAQQNRTGHLRDKMRECAFLVFSSSIATDQSPHLRTTAFLLNRSFFQAQPPRSIASAEDIRRVQAPLNEAYAGAFDYFISKAIGPFKRVANIDELRIVGVPQAVVQKFLFDPSFNQPDLFDPSSRGLQRNELAAQWRAQGERFGWGPRQAEALLFALERERISSVLKDQICARFRDVERICRDAKDSAKRMLKSERSTTIERSISPKTAIGNTRIEFFETDTGIFTPRTITPLNSENLENQTMLNISFDEPTPAQKAAVLAELKRALKKTSIHVPQESLRLLYEAARQDTGGSQAARSFLFWLAGQPDPTGFVGDGGLELRRLDRPLKTAAFEVIAWWAGPTKSDQPLYELLGQLRARFAPEEPDAIGD